MAKLSVNINKVALIRNSRGENFPNLVKVAQDCEKFGAQGITVHPRPDERHIKYADISLLKQVVTTELNVEGYPSDRFIELCLTNQPEQVTLVPDPPGVLTSNSGWDTLKNKSFLSKIIKLFKAKGIRVSLFLNPEVEFVRGAHEIGADRIEFYTGNYAKEYPSSPENAIAAFKVAAAEANKLNLGINAGHDLNLENLTFFKRQTEGLLEVSIGHALISDALYYGLENTIKMYLLCLK